MKRLNRPCEICIVRAACNQPCPALVRYANIFLYELSINPYRAIWRHKYFCDNQHLLSNWFKLVDFLNQGYLITVTEPSWANHRHSMEFEMRHIWEIEDDGEQS